MLHRHDTDVDAKFRRRTWRRFRVYRTNTLRQLFNYYFRYAVHCRPVTEFKMNDLEWLFHVKIHFWPALLESERLNVKK